MQSSGRRYGLSLLGRLDFLILTLQTQLSTDDLREIAKFLSRWDLDALPLTSRRFRPITNAMTHVCLRALDHTRFTYALGHIYSRNRFHVEVAVGGDTVYKEDLWESELIEALAPRFRSAGTH